MADTSSQKKVVITPATAFMNCTGSLDLKAVLSPPDPDIMVSIEGGGRNAKKKGDVTLSYKPKDGDCGKADIEFTASAPGYEDGTAKVTVVKAVISNLENRVPIYRSQQENGSHRANHLRFTTTPDGVKVKIFVNKLSGDKGAAKFKDNNKTSIEITSNGETELLILGVTNSDVKDNLDVKIYVGGDYLLAHKQFSVRTWPEGFGVKSSSQTVPGQLDWVYSWRSESGTDGHKYLQDIDDNIYIGEIVRYPQTLPQPPYSGTVRYPTVIVGKAKKYGGEVPDVNTAPGFSKPYKADSNTATQVFGFWDLIWNPGEIPKDSDPREGDMKDLDANYNITRDIFKEGKWKFRIKKDEKTSSDYVLPGQ